MRDKKLLGRQLLSCALGIIVILAIWAIFPTPPFKPLNALTLEPLQGFTMETSSLSAVLEPFVGLPSYLASVQNPVLQGISVIIWIVAVYISWQVFSQKPIDLQQGIRRLAFLLAIGSCIVFYMFFAPFPAVRLVPQDKDTILIDFHSHTYFSHDGLASPDENTRWHLNHNFSAWFITEHWKRHNSEFLENLSRETLFATTVLGGEEVSDNIRNLFLVLGGNTSFFESRWLPTKELVSRAHSEKGIVIATRWWKVYTPLNDLIAAGVDGFEAANAGHPNLTDSKRQDLLRISSATSLIIISASDWHGWGNFCRTWNAIRIPGWKNMTYEEKRSSILNALRDKKPEILPILFGRKELQGIWRIIFSPFICGFYYFSSLKFFGLLSWIAWGLLIAALARSRLRHYCFYTIIGMGGMLLLAKGGRYILLSSKVPSTIVFPTGITLNLIGAGLLIYIFILIRKKK